MRVGLVDVDGAGRSVYPNLALMKISAWHKAQGDSVEWANPMFSEVDRVYMSKVFTFSEDNRDIWNCEVVKGGTGYDIASRLSDEIDAMQPDYSIYPSVDAHTAYGFLTRGCRYFLIDDWDDVNERLTALRKYKWFKPHGQPYRDFGNKGQVIPQWQKDMAHWMNKHNVYFAVDFKDFEPRKGFKCKEYYL